MDIDVSFANLTLGSHSSLLVEEHERYELLYSQVLGQRHIRRPCIFCENTSLLDSQGRCPACEKRFMNAKRSRNREDDDEPSAKCAKGC